VGGGSVHCMACGGGPGCKGGAPSLPPPCELALSIFVIRNHEGGLSQLLLTRRCKPAATTGTEPATLRVSAKAVTCSETFVLHIDHEQTGH